MIPPRLKDSPPDDDAPTVEEEVVDVDGTNTDQLDAKYRVHVVAASEADSGTVEFDERGQPRWKVRDNQPSRNPETTFDLLKALDNAAIVIDEPAPPVEQPKREPGYNPYDTVPAKPKRKP